MQDNFGIILIVDDEAAVLSAMRRELLDLAPILTAGSANEALSVIETHNISVVLSDYKMPETDGVSFLSALRETHPQITRLLFTAYTGEDLLLEAVNKAGIFHFIKKPWEVESVKITIQRALDFYSLNNNIIYYKQRLTHLEDIKKGSLSLISHELKTPLSVVKGYADMIDPYVSDDVEKIIYKRMQEALDRLQTFVDHIVDIVSIDSESVEASEPVEFSALVASLFEEYHPQIHYSICTKKSLLLNFVNKFANFIKDRQSPYSVSIREIGNHVSLIVEITTDKTYSGPQLPLFEALEPNVHYLNYDGDHNLELGYARKAIKTLGGEFHITPKKKSLCFEIILPK